jgi:SHS2 domain-containing protein
VVTACVVAPVAYDLVEHTADLGVVVRGSSLADLFARAAAVLADILYDPGRVQEGETRRRTVRDTDPELLLVRWLNELIVLRETEDFLWRRVEVDLDALGLQARLSGETFDPARHEARTALKAATYHQLSVRGAGGRFEARVIFDV